MNTTNHIEVQRNVKPVSTPVRKISHALKPKCEKELKGIGHIDIIEPIEKPTEVAHTLQDLKNDFTEKIKHCNWPMFVT